MTEDPATRSSDTTVAAGRASERLSLRLIVHKALVTARERFWAVMLPAVVLFVPLTLLDTYVEHFADEQTSESSAAGVLVKVLSLAGTSGLLFGWVLYTGLLDTVVGAHQFGRPEEPVRRRLRNLPYMRLIGASIVLDVLVIIGSGFFVVPGRLRSRCSGSWGRSSSSSASEPWTPSSGRLDSRFRTSSSPLARSRCPSSPSKRSRI